MKRGPDVLEDKAERIGSRMTTSKLGVDTFQRELTSARELGLSSRVQVVYINVQSNEDPRSNAIHS